MISNEHEDNHPVLGKGSVKECSVVEGSKPAGSVFLLKISFALPEESLPVPGQFFLLRAAKTGILLGRPISVYNYEKKDIHTILDFLILLKGKGTQELCTLEPDDEIELLGPLGNIFPKPGIEDKKICIIGGGIGIAPVAGFAETLTPRSYDFIASFKSGKYGLDYVKANELSITTDDGSVGIKGMLSAAIDAEKIKSKGYTTIYACGPTPMLAYIQKICRETKIKCWLSMESKMACGMGVCLGCTISTTEGNKRCCKDGPVFDGNTINFPLPSTAKRREPVSSEPDLSVKIAGITLRNPVIASSGTFGFGTEYKPIFDINKLGAICSKGLTLEPREGNSGIRLWETPSGLMNSIGLQNPGIPHFIDHELPEMMKMEPVTIANLSGSSLESYVKGAELLDKTNAPLIELNISCPNVSSGGAAWGMQCDSANKATAAVRAVTSKPLIVKLTPQAPDVVGVAMACREAGADAISLCNSFQGVAIDIEKGIPVFDKVRAGFGGPAIRPIALRLVYDVVQEMNKLPAKDRIPVIGIGGIADWKDAVEFIMAGATAVAVGTNTFANPLSMIQIIKGINDFMKRKGYTSIEEIRGIAQ